MVPSIAIAVSGLGRIRRGSETWAMDLADGLAEAGVDVRLYGAATASGKVPVRRIWTLSRTSPFLAACSPRLQYLFEQRIFSRFLIRRLRRDTPGIIHITDPQVSWWVRQAFRGTNVPVLYMDGLLLGPDWNWRFDHVQVLAPEYLTSAQREGRETRGWHVVPHFIDPDQFRPLPDRRVARSRFVPGVPEAQVVALAAGDFAPGSSKRLHYVIEEVARIPAPLRPHLVLVGNATEAECRALTTFSRNALGQGVTLHASLPRNEMCDLYRATDVFLHGALREPFGIVLLEAMASGLPVLAHQFEVTRWIVGDGGETDDLSQPGRLAGMLQARLAEAGWLQQTGVSARQRVNEHFSKHAVIPRYMDCYLAVGRQGEGGASHGRRL
jgi:glycosyltransferase involved in cell wall biosynthesis